MLVDHNKVDRMERDKVLGSAHVACTNVMGRSRAQQPVPDRLSAFVVVEDQDSKSRK